MRYPSVDKLQQALASTVFNHAVDKKKAAGRALGTIVEIVTYYTLRTWGLRDHVVIERSLGEFANAEIAHNVEFTLHPILSTERISVPADTLPLTVSKLRSKSKLVQAIENPAFKAGQLMTSAKVRRNSCVLAEADRGPVVANIDDVGKSIKITISELHASPFAMVECKRVGVEEGMKKGPQTIEKAKQGAYVARVVSSLQKLRSISGERLAYIERASGDPICGPLEKVVAEVLSSNDRALLSHFIMTIGVVSNHGNWFTSENHNKELKVLAQSYDWLLFLTDRGLAQFIDRMLLNPRGKLKAARAAFLGSYGNTKTPGNAFTKVTINDAADAELQEYFASHEAEIESWFNVIAPKAGSIDVLQAELRSLRNKNWKAIHAL